MVKRYNISGMTCSACSSGIEKAVGKLDGVSVCEVSLMAKSMKVDFDENTVGEDLVFSTVKSLGYGISAEGAQNKEDKPRDKKTFIIFMNNPLRSVVFIEKGFTILNRYAYG